MSPIASALAALRSGQGLKGQLMRGGVGSVAVKLGSTGLNVLLAIVLARALGAEGFGVYSFVFALITIMAIPAQMGLPNLVVRETAKAQANGDWALMKGLWRWSSLMALAMSAALMAIGAIAAWLFAAQLPEGGLVVFYWGLVLVPLVALGNLRGAALRGLRHVVQGQLPEFILRPAFLIVLVLAMHFGLSARALTASDAMMLHAVASLMAFAIGAVLLVKARPEEFHDGLSAKAESTLWLKSALPLGVVDGMLMVNQNIGLVVLGFLAPAEDVGLFRVAAQGAALVVFGLQAVNMVVAPHFARLYASGEIDRLRKIVTIGARIGMAIASPVVIIFLFFGRDILSVLFGSEYELAYWAFALLTLGQSVNVISGSVGFLLNMTGHERDVVLAVSISASANVVLTLILTPVWGVEGAAFAAMISLVFWNSILVMRVWKRLGIDATVFGIRSSI